MPQNLITIGKQSFTGKNRFRWAVNTLKKATEYYHDGAWYYLSERKAYFGAGMTKKDARNDFISNMMLGRVILKESFVIGKIGNFPENDKAIII